MICMISNSFWSRQRIRASIFTPMARCFRLMLILSWKNIRILKAISVPHGRTSRKNLPICQRRFCLQPTVWCRRKQVMQTEYLLQRWCLIRKSCISAMKKISHRWSRKHWNLVVTRKISILPASTAGMKWQPVLVTAQFCQWLIRWLKRLKPEISVISSWWAAVMVQDQAEIISRILWSRHQRIALYWH